MKTTLSFDFFKQQSKQMSEHKLFALIAGIRGAGKSTVIGTLNVKTFLITSTLESHAIAATKLYGGENILPTLFDIDEHGKQLKADAAMANLHNILDFLIESPDLANNVECVALDSISVIDKTLLETSRIVNEKNNWTVIDIMESEHLKVIRKLKELHRKGLHILVTMPFLATLDEDGLYTSASPEIRGSKTSSVISGIFPEILPVTKYAGEYIFQMDLTVKKISKDAVGKEKATIFHPRISGLSAQDISSISKDLILPADLSYIYQLKKVKQGGEE